MLDDHPNQLGGSDPQRATDMAVAAAAASPDRELEVIAVIGGAVEARQSVTRRLSQLGLGARLQVRTNVSDMRALMEWADVGITAAGSTTLCGDPRRRADMSRRARALVDGQGATRAVRAMWQDGARP